ncbi:uncharacterized protein LOC111907122 [Lactuca sativa]|uniref:uncharacterized protein LOC111907122 n=1 Tax=Lactuca sativa TaxID=4236 RepID=UPI000CD91EFD|nr:uncharacterized protein LOC111907122 [Lactuca sativa]
MVGYKNKRGIPKCTIKIDIQKAYDIVDWNFLNRILKGFGFHPIMTQWIMACVSSPWFMLNFNGEDHGYFEGKRGLRQGDPLSPYLFTIVMEVFNIILVFSYGNGNSARIIRDALDELKKVSGLKVSMEKSQIFFSCVKPNMRRIILGILPFDIRRFPFKYLGVPMCVTKLFGRDCRKLIEKIKMRIFNWKSKALSFAGRLQLINSILTSIHVYWASIFKIPIATIKEIKKLCRTFLWANGEIVKGKAKVKWNDICKSKVYGGLGVKNLRKWNDALLAKHVWNKKSMSWTWKRFLEVRKIVRPHVVSCVGNGMSTSLWHDWWHPLGILGSIISRRDWVSNGFSDSSLVWCDINNFGDKVPWHDIVWYSNCIPRNSFILWMAILKRLKTQVRVRGWEVSGNLLCPFCAVTLDSHNHLFFNCDYSHCIWRYFCNKIGINLFVDDWIELIVKLCSLFKKNSGENLINKCVFASCVTHIWKGRNSRLFSNRRNSYEGVIGCIESEIRLKLLGLRKKAKMVNDKVDKAWGISGMEKI